MQLESPEFKLAAAREENIYKFKRTRISLLTSRLIRVEENNEGNFEDRQTTAVINRDLGAVKHSVKRDGDTVIIKTADLVIRFVDDGKPLSKNNLTVEFQVLGKKSVWHPGKIDRANLRGTTRCLDNCKGADVCTWEGEYIKPIELSDGLISRSGWAIVDDTKSLPMTKISGKRKWPAPRQSGTISDQYLLVYGHDYTAALKDAAEIFGSQPLPPRFAFGYWYCRYWAYSDVEIEKLIAGYDHSEIPFDVMVIDMDWHLEGWTGYTWDKRFFPDPDEFLRHLHDRKIKVSLNLHPADGVGKHEAAFVPMCAALGLDPKKTERIPFNVADPNFMKAYFKYLHHPLEKGGVDFWWLDWQQGEASDLPGLDPLTMLNAEHWHDMQSDKNHRRPLIFSRYGGIGSGRLPIGFSGDTLSTWSSLQYQIGFTSTASNVLYGYWSHDIGGHVRGPVGAELYLRWMQFGVYSPILRTHTSKNPQGDRRFWAYPLPYSDLMAESARRRYELLPYIYTEARAAVDSGVSLCRPMYYEWQESDEAYRCPDQYMFGSQLLISPVVSPCDEALKLAEKSTWLPEGEWFDETRGRLVTGPCKITDRYLLGETPVFARAGAIIPEQRNLLRTDDFAICPLVAKVYPGESGEYTMYEDDGKTDGYLRGEAARIRFAHHKEEKARVVTIKLVGKTVYPGFNPRREVKLVLPGVEVPKSVEIGSNSATPVFRFEGVSAATPVWQYDGARAELIIHAGMADLSKGVKVKITYTHRDEFAAASGLRGMLARLGEEAQLHNQIHRDTKYGSSRLGQELAHTGRRISIKPTSFFAEVKNLRDTLPMLSVELNRLLKDYPILSNGKISPEVTEQKNRALVFIREARK